MLYILSKSDKSAPDFKGRISAFVLLKYSRILKDQLRFVPLKVLPLPGGNPTAAHRQKSASLIFFDLKREEFWTILRAQEAARLTPAGDDKPKIAEIKPF